MTLSLRIYRYEFNEDQFLSHQQRLLECMLAYVGPLQRDYPTGAIHSPLSDRLMKRVESTTCVYVAVYWIDRRANEYLTGASMFVLH
jgi:hypothetical protein